MSILKKVAKKATEQKNPLHQHQTPFEVSQCDQMMKKQNCPFLKK
jgi:hypothetical protein